MLSSMSMMQYQEWLAFLKIKDQREWGDKDKDGKTSALAAYRPSKEDEKEGSQKVINLFRNFGNKSRK